MQQYHSDYGDYWRLTPLAIKRLFEDNGMTVVYQSFNNNKAASVYTFTIATKPIFFFGVLISIIFQAIQLFARRDMPAQISAMRKIPYIL